MWYRSRNFGSAQRLRRGMPGLFEEACNIEWLILEGGGRLAEIWHKEADRRGVSVLCIGAEQWRELLLYPRQQRTGREAKHYAEIFARRVIEWSGISRPTSLRHDTAEAILTGLWGVLKVGWLEELPRELGA